MNRPSTRQQNFENRKGYSCQSSEAERRDAEWAEEELKLELEIISEKYPEADKEELEYRLNKYGMENNYDEITFGDFNMIIEEIVTEHIEG